MFFKKSRDNEEIKYLGEFFWLQGFWWQRFIDKQHKTEALRKVTDLDIIPIAYHNYYQTLEAQ